MAERPPKTTRSAKSDGVRLFLSQVDIFELMPRMVDVASRIYPTDDWLERRKRIFKFAR